MNDPCINIRPALLTAVYTCVDWVPIILNCRSLCAAVKMNGVVKTDVSDSIGRGSPTMRAEDQDSLESGVIQPPGIGPAIHLNGSAVNDQPVQVEITCIL